MTVLIFSTEPMTFLPSKHHLHQINKEDSKEIIAIYSKLCKLGHNICVLWPNSRSNKKATYSWKSRYLQVVAFFLMPLPNENGYS